jgi:hypothetical protein
MTHWPEPSGDDDADRQMLLLAMAELALRRPGWNWTLGRLAERLGGRDLFEAFKKTSADTVQPDGLRAAAERVAAKHKIALRPMRPSRR